MLKFQQLWLPLLMGLLLSNQGSACPVCAAAADRSENAYIVSTFALSFLPLLLIASIAGWILATVRKSLQAPLERESRPDATRINNA